MPKINQYGKPSMAPRRTSDSFQPQQWITHEQLKGAKWNGASAGLRHIINDLSRQANLFCSKRLFCPSWTLPKSSVCGVQETLAGLQAHSVLLELKPVAELVGSIESKKRISLISLRHCFSAVSEKWKLLLTQPMINKGQNEDPCFLTL